MDEQHDEDEQAKFNQEKMIRRCRPDRWAEL